MPDHDISASAPLAPQNDAPALEPEASPFEGVPAVLQRALEQRGFDQLTPIQRGVLDAPGEGRNLRLTSQTGSGKTVALGFALYDALAAATRGGQGSDADNKGSRGAQPTALIIVPTRELANQVHAELEWLYAGMPNLRTDVVTGGTDVRGDQRRLRRGLEVLVGTPGRLLDHVRSGTVELGAIREVVLDEADQMLDMGFREELEALVEQLPEERRSHLVSATFPPAVVQLARAFQRDPLMIEGTKLGAANTDIEHVAHLVHLRDRYAALVNILLSNIGTRCLVFVQRRAEASELAEKLGGDGFAALPISGDLPQAQRTRTLSAFKLGTVDILVATDVAARGIHVDEVGVVVHTDFPREIETYTHRSGRTGRAGQKGQSVSLVVPQAKRRVEAMTHRLGIDVQWQPLPTPKKIRKRITKQTRRILHARLESAQLPESLMQYSAELIASVAPEKLVAVLLQMAERPLPTEPRAVADASEQRFRPPTHGEKPWRGKPFGREKGPAERGGARPSRGKPRPSFGRKRPANKPRPPRSESS